MRVFRKIKKQYKYSLQVKDKENTIGFVPTLGCLHEGHLSLVRKAKENTDIVSVSIFINPLQFGRGEDFKSYPRNIDRDLELLKKEKVDCVFIPDTEEIYSEDFNTKVTVPHLSEIYCGKTRPVHFQGVTTIVLKLFNIIQPDIAIFGEKDYQQYIIIKKMVRDLNIPVSIIPSPIIREDDGLAISSRNRYLTTEQRKEAVCLYKSMELALKMVSSGEKRVDKIKKKMTEYIESKKYTRIDYIEFVDPIDLKKVHIIEKPIRILEAVWIGNARLIDNMEIKP